MLNMLWEPGARAFERWRKGSHTGFIQFLSTMYLRSYFDSIITGEDKLSEESPWRQTVPPVRQASLLEELCEEQGFLLARPQCSGNYRTFSSEDTRPVHSLFIHHPCPSPSTSILGCRPDSSSVLSWFKLIRKINNKKK